MLLCEVKKPKNLMSKADMKKRIDQLTKALKNLKPGNIDARNQMQRELKNLHNKYHTYYSRVSVVSGGLPGSKR